MRLIALATKTVYRAKMSLAMTCGRNVLLFGVIRRAGEQVGFGSRLAGLAVADIRVNCY